MIETLYSLPDKVWLMEFKINDTSLTLYNYLKGLKEHDIQHLNQITSFLNVHDSNSL